MCPRLLLVSVAVAVVLGSALGACSSGRDGVGVPAGDLPSVTGGGADTVDVAAAAEVRAVHTRVMTELFARDERVDDATAMLDLAAELTTGPLLADINEGVNRRLLSGYKAVGEGYESHIVSVELTSDTTATVLDCSRDTRAFYDANGSLLVPADAGFKLRTSQLVLVDGRWLESELISSRAKRCDPAAP